MDSWELWVLSQCRARRFHDVGVWRRLGGVHDSTVGPLYTGHFSKLSWFQGLHNVLLGAATIILFNGGVLISGILIKGRLL